MVTDRELNQSYDHLLGMKSKRRTISLADFPSVIIRTAKLGRNNRPLAHGEGSARFSSPFTRRLRQSSLRSSSRAQQRFVDRARSRALLRQAGPALRHLQRRY